MAGVFCSGVVAVVVDKAVTSGFLLIDLIAPPTTHRQRQSTIFPPKALPSLTKLLSRAQNNK